MAEGLDAGTVYVRVVPQIDSAANQQVGQQIGQQVQAAMNVRVGAGGGGGMGGGGGIGGGGGGTSGNVPVGVVSAKMAAAAAEARLSGVMQGGSYSGLQSYASEVALQSSWASRNMPKSAFDYRMQAKSSDADRRLMEIDSRVSTFTREPNAHLSAYQSSQDRDRYLRNTSRVGPSFDMEDMAALGVPSPTAGSQFDAHVAARTASMRPSAMSRLGSGLYRTLGGRSGFRMAGFQAMFGAMDVANAYNASMDADRVAARGDPVATMRADMKTVETIRSGMLGGPATAFRQGWDRFTGRSVFGDEEAYRAVEGAEEGLKDDASLMNRRIRANASGTAAKLTNFEAAGYSIRGNVDRDVRAARSAGMVESQNLESEKFAIRQAIHGTTDRREKDRLRGDLNSLNKSGDDRIAAAGRLGDARADDILLRYRQGIAGTGRDIAVYDQLAAGRPGMAEQYAFQNNLLNSQDAADNLGVAAGDMQRRAGTAAWAGWVGTQRKTAGANDALARAFHYSAAGDDRRALVERQAARRAEDMAGANDKNRFSIETRLDKQDAAEVIDFNRSESLWRGGLRLDRDVSAITASSDYNFATGSRLADIKRIAGRKSLEADDLFTGGKAKEAMTVLETGRNDLQSYKRQMMAGVSMQEVSINRFAPGGADTVTILKSIDEGIKELNRSGKSTGGGATAQ